jgi:sulfofructose kinase
MDITGLGENATDLVLRISHFPAPEGKVEIRSVATRLGGQIATAIVACRKWGLQARYIGSAGDDGRAEQHGREFSRLGIEAHIVSRRDAPSRLSYVLVEEGSGSRAVLWRRDKRLRLRVSDLQREWIVRSRLLFFDGENPLAARKATYWAQSAGLPTMCDFDSATPNADELLRLVDYPVLTADLSLRLAKEKNHLAALPILHRRYQARVICASLGIRGALAWDGTLFWYSPSYQVRTADTTGAGDLFHAGFAFGLLRGWGWQRVLDFACAAAGLNCTAEGARGCIASVHAIERLCRTNRRNPAWFSPAQLERAGRRARSQRG